MSEDNSDGFSDEDFEDFEVEDSWSAFECRCHNLRKRCVKLDVGFIPAINEQNYDLIEKVCELHEENLELKRRLLTRVKPASHPAPQNQKTPE